MIGERSILIIGLPYFSKKIAHSLSRFDNNNYYTALNTSGKIFDKIKHLLNLLNADIVYSIGGTLVKTNTIDIALAFRKKVVMHWVGTDVLNAISDFKNKRLNNEYIERINHLCEVSWIKEELKQVGIDAEIVPLVTFDEKIGTVNCLPENFTILSYVAKGREEFYGIEKIIKLAVDFPDIELKIVGISEYHKSVPKNIRFLGWVENMNEQYQNCVLYLRMPEHDGLAFSVLEAMANGRYVGYSYNFDNVFYIKNYIELKHMVSKLKQTYDEGKLPPNIQGRDFIVKAFSQKEVLSALSSVLLT